MSAKLDSSVNKIIKEHPKRTKMIVENMKEMSSLDHQPNDPKKVFAFLNTHMEYVVNFFKDPSSDPRTFGPPNPPNSVKMSKKDLNNFTARATGFVSDHWDVLQNTAILKSDGKKQIATKPEVKLKTLQVGRHIEAKKENPSFRDIKNATLTGIGSTPISEKNEKLVKAGTKGAALGLFKGGKPGAIKGAMVSVGMEMSRQVAEKKLERQEQYSNKQENNSPLPKLT